MIFAFDRAHTLNFWMKNTIIPLDIAYLDSKGVVVATHTMAPLDERSGQYSSGSPAQYAIEVNAGVWGRIGFAPATSLRFLPRFKARSVRRRTPHDHFGSVFLGANDGSRRLPGSCT
jgi:uncharacterized membrane protein (UPF0127 family)